MQTDSGQHQYEIDAAREAYGNADSRFLTLVSRFYADHNGAAEQLLGLADEYGASQTVTALLGNPEQFGTLAPTATDGYVADMADTLEEALEAVLIAQDRLDQATALRERQLRNDDPTRAQVVVIGGREFVIDPAGRELRSVDNPTERYVLSDDIARTEVPRGSTLTEQLAKDHNSARAEPRPPRTPSRGR